MISVIYDLIPCVIPYLISSDFNYEIMTSILNLSAHSDSSAISYSKFMV